MELKASSISSASIPAFRITRFKHGHCQFNGSKIKLELDIVNVKERAEKAAPCSIERSTQLNSHLPVLLQSNSNPAIQFDASRLLVLQLLQNDCKTHRDIDQIHARMITTGFIKDASFTTRIILRLSCSSCPLLTDFARSLFFSQHSSLHWGYRDDPFLWNAVLKSYSHGLKPRQALVLFRLMLESGVLADKFSFSLVLKACSRNGMVNEGKQIHGVLSKLEIGSDMYLQNGLIWLYLQCGDCECARQLFDRMPTRDSVSYNSMIDGYVKSGMLHLARELFDSMPREDRNLITWNSMLSGFVQLGDDLELAWELFKEMPERDLVSWNTMIDACVKYGKIEDADALFNEMPEKDVISWASMIDGYAKIGNISVARSLFDEMPVRDVISCNAIMAGYAQNGLHAGALDIFHSMQSEMNLLPDDATLLIILSSIAQLGNLDEGIAIHDYIIQRGFQVGGKLGVALVDMYSKCGSIEKALSMFERLHEKDVDHWNAMIGGLAVHGLGKLAFHLFMEMEKSSVQPDDITFIGLLNACGHSGLVKEGLIGFELMRRVHRISPRLQHYGCVVDLLGRAGYLEEAIMFINEMPIEPNEVIWRTLLTACKIHENFEIGRPVACHLIGQDSSNPSSYILLSQIYAGLQLWEHASRTRTAMKQREIKKLPGCSWIELEGLVHEFSVHDKSHPQAMEIYSMLGNSWLPKQEVACQT